MILYIGNKLSKHGYTPTCVETLGKQLGITYQIKTISDKKNKVLRLLDIIFSIIKERKKTEIILIDTYSTSNFYFALTSAFLSNILKIKYIPILHGGSLPSRIEKYPVLSNYIFKNAIINVSPSKYLEHFFINNGYKVIYIPNNIDLSLYNFKLRENIKPKLLYVRAFHNIYNPIMAIQVFKNLLLRYPNAELCMVGPDKDGSGEEVKALAEKYNILDKIKITGKLEKEKWIELSKNYDIFINTTNFDNQPVSIIEAMSLGFPIVSTDAGGMPYLIEDNKTGMIVKKNNDKEMLDSIISLLEKKDFGRKLSENARKASEEFNWIEVEKKWTLLLNKLLERGTYDK